jgi:ABC-type uncharacterized transport system substrate-binding protein
MRRIGLAVILALSLAFAPLAVEGQAGKVYRVGFLWDTPAVWPHALEAFRQGLRDLGWVEGQNIIIEYRWTEGRFDRLPSLVEELVRLKVDLIVAPTSIYTGAAQRATSTIPIVFASHADPIGSGHVASLAHPGTNATGLTIKQLAQLALTHKLPSMFGPREHVEAGGLMSYSPDRADLYRRAATYVDKILKGANPADLPVQQATKFELVINLKTAKALGLTIPQSILVRADEVIQ